MKENNKNREIEIKAYKLVADLIDSALIGGWGLSENEEEGELLLKEIRRIEYDLYKIKKITNKALNNL